MQSDEIDFRSYNIFIPGHIESLVDMASRRLAYYTSPDTAMKIIKNKEIWLRNASVMNDRSEISYGLNMIENALTGEVGKGFRDEINRIFPQTQAMDIKKNLMNWGKTLLNDTHLACLSLHDESEDQHGRLSMWRAYGDVAVVLKNSSLIEACLNHSIFFTKVDYSREASIKGELKSVVRNLSDIKNFEVLKRLGWNRVKGFVDMMFMMAIVGTKHPVFEEEREWRLYVQRDHYPDDGLHREIVSKDGVPQEILKLPLEDVGFSNVIDRIILGPIPYPEIAKRAFEKLLNEAGITDADSKVVVSNIPLRLEG